MRKCWAKSHSPCGEGISREHLISAGVFDQTTIFIQGFDWCPEEKEVGLAAIVSKILCRKHNSILERSDRAGIAAVAAIEETIDPGKNTVSYIDGLEFERWLLKVSINLTFKGQLKLGVGMLGAEPGYPAPYLLEAVFGDRPLCHKMGLYVIFPYGEFRFRKGEMAIVPIHKNREIWGVYFNLRGIHLFLSLYPGYAPPPLEQLGDLELPQHVMSPTPMYRPPSIQILRPDGTESLIRFSWK